MRTVVEVVGVSACLIGVVLVVAWIFGEHRCRICDRRFDTRRELDEHIARHPN